MKPKISMIVNSYKGGERLIPTLESHRLQTYPDKELIITDDATPDGITQKIIEDWLSENERYFKRVVFVKNPVNRGGAENFKNAALKTTGDVVFQTEQGDVIYGPQTIEKLSDEIERQRLDGLADPYIWFGHYRAFSFVGGEKIDKNKNLTFYSQPQHFNLIEKSPDKALAKAVGRGFIGGPSVIFSRRYFDEDVYPQPEKSENVWDYPCLFWNLINGQRIGIVRQFIHWYEHGVGISSTYNPKMESDVAEIHKWMSELATDEKSKKKLALMQKYNIHCKTPWQHPIAFLRRVLRRFCMRSYDRVMNATGLGTRWIQEVAERSSPSFGDDMFAPENYPSRPEGIF